jgi:hypothetical protein
MKFDKQTFRLLDDNGFGKKSLGVGIFGFLLSVVGYFVNSHQFFYSYLTAFAFWFTIAMGGLFFVMLHHLTNATWSVVLRRIAENLMSNIIVMALLFIPMLVGIKDLYHWSHPDLVAADPLLLKKSPYLNVTFFIIRAAIYFGIWMLLNRLLYKTSLAQDHVASENQTKRFRKISAPGMILFAFTISFAAFDWFMSLDSHWYSTIFGVYIFSGGLLTGLAFITLITIYLKTKGPFGDIVTSEHYHDLGKLLFAFTIFWAYICFSQYFLIWYANIPEETVWFSARWKGAWKYFSLAIIFGHFVIPFFVLITQPAKRNHKVMVSICILLLLVHWIDLYWIIMPNLLTTGATLSWMDLSTMLGIGGIFMWYYLRLSAKTPLLPLNDPRLKASVEIFSE